MLVGLLLAPQLAAAAPAVTVSSWTINGDDAVLGFTFPQSLAAVLAAPGTPAPAVEAIARYVFPKVSVQRGGQSCEALDQGYDLGRIDTRYIGAGLLSFEVLFHCTGGAGRMLLRNDAFFDREPGQISLARVRVANLPPVLRLVTAAGQPIGVGAAGAAGSPLTSYAGLGLRRTLTGLFPVCMAVALLLLSGPRRELRGLMGGLLAGYAGAAVIGSAGWFLQPGPAQAFAGFLLVMVSALLLARRAPARVVVIGLVLLTVAAMAILLLLGRTSAALCLLGACAAGALTVPLTVAEGVSGARWLLPGLGLLVGASGGFFLGSVLAPLHAVASVGLLQALAFNLGALLATAAVMALAAAARTLLRRFGALNRLPVFAELVTATLAAVGAFSILAG